MAAHGGTHSVRERATQRTPAAGPGQGPVHLALCLLVLWVLLGCAHTPPSPLTEATKAHLGTIGVVAAQLPPEVDYQTPGRGGAGGAAIGTATGVGMGIAGATLCLMTLGHLPEACGLAVATPYLMVRYAVDQATDGVSADAIAASETAIQAVLDARTHEAVVRDEVFRLAAAYTNQTLVLLPAEGSRSVMEPTGYRQLAARGIDTVIEITLQRLALQSEMRGEGRSPWSISAADLNPYLTVTVTARTRVLKTADGTELYGRTGDHRGRGATFTEWGANDAQLLRDGLDQLLRDMAGELVAQVFGVAVPPAWVREAPTAPHPAQDPEPGPQ